MKQCNTCKTDAKVLILKQSENKEEYICVQCLISTYGTQIGWIQKQIINQFAEKLNNL